MHAPLIQRRHIGASSYFRQHPFQLMNRTAEKKTNPEPGILDASVEPEYYFKTSTGVTGGGRSAATGVAKVSPIVVIEDVMEDEEWQSCLVTETAESSPAVLGAEDVVNTPLKRMSTPIETPADLESSFLWGSKLDEGSKTSKNLLPTRVLRPRPKME
ncbi:unnamed protein product [Echinostoma caproni]|uniref:Uncharacterized protein n=1 Tax=Echinostoma caproni TaxID=27848 RepID=A0A183BD36_9TREM|nr:unnamed protein product [Echinostoma caproni]